MTASHVKCVANQFALNVMNTMLTVHALAHIVKMKRAVNHEEKTTNTYPAHHSGDHPDNLRITSDHRGSEKEGQREGKFYLTHRTTL